MAKIEIEPGVKLHYQWVGADDPSVDGAERPTVVLLHGLTGNLAIWHLHIAPALRDHARVLTYDLRGHGYSSMPPTGYSADSHADDLGRLLDELDVTKPYLVGHSLGADVALYFAARHPERVEAVMAVEPGLPAMLSQWHNDEWEGWDYWADALAGSGLEVPAEHRTDFEYLMRKSLEMPKQWGPLRGLPRNPKKALKLLDETAVMTEMYEVGSLPFEKLKEITARIVLVYSEDTGFLTTRDLLASQLRNGEQILLPKTDMGHFGPLEQPDVMARHIVELITGAEFSKTKRWDPLLAYGTAAAAVAALVALIALVAARAR
jgi:pimeloyl-ACP methyl ester carboxylesterase